MLRSLVAGIAVLAILSPAASRPAPGEPPAGPLAPAVEHVVSELVLIEVHATGARGRPVPDLTIGDFVLRIDGGRVPEPIASLEYVTPAAGGPEGATAPRPAMGATAPGAGPEGAPPALTPPDRAAAPDTGIPSRTILFFDDAASLPWHMSAARTAAAKVLDRLVTPASQLALVAYEDRRRLRVLHDFTTDRRALSDALETSLHDTGRVSGLESMEFRRGAMTQEEVAHERSTMATEDHHHLTRLLGAMRAMVGALAPWPGRKAMIFMGDGMPMNVADLYGLRDWQLDLATDIDALVSEAMAANVTLDAIQASGLEAGAESKGQTLRAAGLAAIALDTGGQRVISNDLARALDDVEAARDRYYLLGYAPAGVADGRSHGITLQVNRPGVVLRYRRAFTRFPAGEIHARLVRSAFEVPELHPDLDLDPMAIAGPATPTDRSVDLVVYIPAGKVLFVPRPGGAVASLEIGVSVSGGVEGDSPRLARRVDAVLGPASGPRGNPPALDIVTRLRLPTGAQDLTIVVSDLGSGTVGAARLRIEPRPAGAGTDRGLVLYSRDEESLWIDLGSLAEERAAAASRFSPAQKDRFAVGERVAWGFREVAGNGEPPAALRLSISNGAQVLRTLDFNPADPRSTAEPPRAGLDTAPLSLDGLAAGEYALVAEEPQTDGPAVIGSLRFRIRPRAQSIPMRP